MPELPEVETTLRGIKPHILHQTVLDVVVRQPQLRFPVPDGLKQKLAGQVLRNVMRRGKYLLFLFDSGTLLLHLGMSGRLRVLKTPTPPQKHDHIDIGFANHTYLRYTDPRRFGAILFTSEDPAQHPLLVNIGPEPLTAAFHGDYLWQRARGRKLAVKSYLMNSQVVAGVGNIYAAEALFQARIRPDTPAGKVSRTNYQQLALAIKTILKQAIAKGGTTLKDFLKSDGQPGYFSLALKVYGRGGLPCLQCTTPLTLLCLGQRSTVYCRKCQK